MNTTLHVTIDKKIKERASKMAKELGFDLSSFIKASLKLFIQTESFYVAKSPKITPRLAATIEQARNEYARGEALGPFTGAELDNFLLR